jgi:ubiquinone/menaquinone biosynthesis C-methylase UbiE
MPAEPFKFDGVLDEWKSNQILKFCRSTVLDIGCNTGELVGFLNGKGIYAEGMDASHAFIQKAREKFPQCVFHQGVDLGIFADNQFESVVAWNVLEHIDDDRHALAEMLRIAGKNVILSIPKEDELSLPDSRVTYRPYVDPTHKHYYNKAMLTEMILIIGDYSVYFEDTTRVRPLLAYTKIGIPRWCCSMIDTVFWNVGKNKELFHANLMAVISKMRQ